MTGIQLQIKGDTHQIEFPDCYEVVCAGPLKAGDRVYNEATRQFETCRMNGPLDVRQCHLVIRMKYLGGAK